LSFPSEDHLLVRDKPGESHRVDGRAARRDAVAVGGAQHAASTLASERSTNLPRKWRDTFIRERRF